jgi:hypothetical protein|tara:strand:+ start:280 stop:504 length:225 start_codon:yes stop_codon:yes gene_type:complete
MTKFNSIEALLTHVTENTNQILEDAKYSSEEDPEGLIRELEMEALKELLDEMVDLGLIKIVGKTDDGENLYTAV